MGALFRCVTPLFVALFALMAIVTAPADAATRRAFIVGNSAYQFTAVLPNPVSDAQDVAARLRDLGWDVTVQLDISRAEMLKAFAAFTRQLRPDDTSLVYFAGHALQMGGENYLAPVDARIESEEGVKRQFVPLNALLADLSRLSRTRIVILDACRDNPFAEGIAESGKTRSAGTAKGLARVYAGVGSFIVYSTQPGNVALDGSGRNSPFTRALLQYMPLAGADVHAVMRRVRAAVQQETNEAQIPWENSSLVDEVAFAATGAPPRQMADAPPMPAPRSDPRGVPTTPTVVEKFHYVTGLDPKGDNFLALRTGPMPSDVRIATMGPDTLLRVHESRGPWRRVELIDGMTGWAHSNWIACCRTMAVPRPHAVAVPMPGQPRPAPSSSPSGAESCNDLWFRRNAIWHSYGYCFTTARARQVFDTSSCFRDQRAAQAAMSPASRAEVDSLQARERALGCR